MRIIDTGGVSVTNKYSLDLDGSNEYVSLPTSLIDAAMHDSTAGEDKAFSIAAWVKMDDATRFRICGSGATSNKYGMLFTTTAADLLYFSLNSSDAFNSNDIIATGSAMTANEGAWAHVAVTYDGSATAAGITLYIDGSDDSATPSSNGTYTDLNRPASEAFRIGQAIQVANLANGKFADLVVLPYEATAAQVAELDALTNPYNYSGWAAAATRPSAWYVFGDHPADDGTGTTGTIRDITGGGYDGTPTNTEATDIVNDAP
jgi:hypothetical protein